MFVFVWWFMVVKALIIYEIWMSMAYMLREYESRFDRWGLWTSSICFMARGETCSGGTSANPYNERRNQPCCWSKPSLGVRYIQAHGSDTNETHGILRNWMLAHESLCGASLLLRSWYDIDYDGLINPKISHGMKCSYSYGGSWWWRRCDCLRKLNVYGLRLENMNHVLAFGPAQFGSWRLIEGSRALVDAQQRTPATNSETNRANWLVLSNILKRARICIKPFLLHIRRNLMR